MSVQVRLTRPIMIAAITFLTGLAAVIYAGSRNDLSFRQKMQIAVLSGAISGVIIFFTT